MKSDIPYIEHMLDAMDAIAEFQQQGGLDVPIVRSAIERQLSIVGEAARRLSDAMRERYSDVPWRQIIGTRNIVIHDYIGVSIPVIEEIITNDLPVLKKQLQEILTQEKKRG